MWVSAGPFLVNTLLGLLLGWEATAAHGRTGVGGLVYDIFCWLGISIAAMAFPSAADARRAWQAVAWSDSRLVHAGAYALIGVMLIGTVGAVFLLDVAYGCVVFFCPLWLMR